MASTKDVKALIKRAEKQGWTVSRTRADHLRWTSPTDPRPYFSSSTPSDKRAIINISKDLQRRGLRLTD